MVLQVSIYYYAFGNIANRYNNLILVMPIACKGKFGVGLVSSLVLLQLLLDPLTIISSQMMLVLCGTACQ